MMTFGIFCIKEKIVGMMQHCWRPLLEYMERHKKGTMTNEWFQICRQLGIYDRSDAEIMYNSVDKYKERHFLFELDQILRSHRDTLAHAS